MKKVLKVTGKVILGIVILVLLAGENDLVIAIGGSVMLIMIGVGIYMLVQTCIIWRAFRKLLR